MLREFVGRGGLEYPPMRGSGFDLGAELRQSHSAPRSDLAQFYRIVPA